MKSEYERAILRITKFDTNNVITTSAMEEDPTQPQAKYQDKENVYVDHQSLRSPMPGPWF